MRANRRDTRNQYNDSNNNNRDGNKNNNNYNNNTNNNDQQQTTGTTQYDKRKMGQQQQASPQKQQQQQPHQTNTQPPQQYHQQQQQQQYQQQHRSQDYRDRSGQRDHGGQRDRSGQRGGQYPDSSMGGRDNSGLPGNLGSVKFTPGYPTKELPPIETRADPSKKFTGRCRLFVGNLPHNTSTEQVTSLFEPFGEIGEVYLGPKSSFAFVKLDTRQNAEAARDALDCSTFDGRTLRVRLAAHANAIRVKHLSPVVTNELLAYAFRYFGEIERAVVVVDDKGKSIGEGIVEYSKKQAALYAVKRCQQECFMLTASPMPVLVEPYDQHDEDEGLPEKSVNKNSIEYKEQRDVGPRFAEQGSFEQSFALRWKELYAIEKQKRERLEQEIADARKTLENQIEEARVEHKAMQLRSQLQELEDNKQRLEQMKKRESMGTQQMEEQRRQEAMLIRQREEEILRRQQLGDQSYLIQQEAALRSQAQTYQDMLGGGSGSADVAGGDYLQHQTDQQNLQASTMTQEADASMGVSSSMLGQVPRTFADVAMMGMNQTYLQGQQQMAQQMTMAAPNQANQAMFAGYIPPPSIQSTLGDETLANNTYASYQQQAYTAPPEIQPQDISATSRQPKMARSYVNHSNNINVTQNRPRKRGRF